MITLTDLADASGLTPVALRLMQMEVATGRGYTKVSVLQKRRKSRVCLRPSIYVDRALKQLRLGLSTTSTYSAPACVHGFVRGRSIVTNASSHLAQDVVLNLDLADFFGSIDERKTLESLTSLGFDEECAEYIKSVTLVDGHLAQGFSTSPLLSNIVFLNSDREMNNLASGAGITFTRYVDDLTFSGPGASIDDDFLNLVSDRLQALGWRVNNRKTRFMRRGGPQFVTGLYVGDPNGPHIPRAMKRRLRRELYFASKYGLVDALQHSPRPMRPERLGGWVHYAAHADPVVGRALREQWWQVAPSSSDRPVGQDWDTVLDEIQFPPGW